MITTVTVNTAIDKIYLVDGFHKDMVNRVRYVAAQAGGKGLNVARVAKSLGSKVVATGFIGGHNGSFIKESVTSEGITGDFVPVKGESRICLNIIDEQDHGQTELLEPGPRVGDSDLARLTEKVRELAALSKVVTISGSLARGLPINSYAGLVKVAGGEGARVILDSSGESLRQGISAVPFMVKPNREEAEALAGKPLPDLESQGDFLKSLLGRGVEVAVLTLGQEGALLGSVDGIFQIKTPPVEVRNTVGCGDAFVAGFATGLARGYDLIASASLAAATATASAGCMGTGECNRELVEQLLPGVRIIKIS